MSIFLKLYVNISESQTYSEYYHNQTNIPILSPCYRPASANIQTCKPMLLTDLQILYRF